MISFDGVNKFLKEYKSKTIIDDDEIVIYDFNDNIIKYINRHGLEENFQYDERNNLIYYEDAFMNKFWQKFDDQDRVIYFKSNQIPLTDYNIEYKDLNKIVTISDGRTITKEEYDQNDNLIKFNDHGKDWIFRYDERNNLIFKRSGTYYDCYEYDENNNITHHTQSGLYEEIYEYNEKGEEIYYENSQGLIIIDGEVIMDICDYDNEWEW